MFLIGLIFTVSLMAIYFGLSVGIASILGGFDAHGNAGAGQFCYELLYQYPLMALATYIFIVSFAIFIATTIRHIGGAMPLVIIPIVFLMVFAMVPLMGNLSTGTLADFDIGLQGWINPIFTFGVFSAMPMKMNSTWFAASIITPLYWAILFVFLGALIFAKRDVK